MSYSGEKEMYNLNRKLSWFVVAFLRRWDVRLRETWSKWTIRRGSSSSWWTEWDHCRFSSSHCECPSWVYVFKGWIEI